MQILIIAGGEGKRMNPLETDKGLYPFLGHTLIAHILDNFPDDKPILVVSPTTHDLYQQIFGSRIQLAVQPKPLGMANAVLSAVNLLDLDAPILILSGGKLLSPDCYRTTLGLINESPTSPHLTAYPVDQYKHGGYLRLKGGKVVEIVEKPGPDNMPSKLYKTNLDYFPLAGDFLEALANARTHDDDVYEVALNHYLKTSPAELIDSDGYHFSLKYPHHLLDISSLFLSNHLQPGIHQEAVVHPTAVIGANVQIDAGAKVMAHAVISGPSYIGKNTLIGNGALVRESCIEANCQLGYGSEVARSYLGPDTKGHMMYVGDSVIEGAVNLSAGTVLANYRFDHKDIVLSLPSGKVTTGKRKFGAVLAKGVITGVNSSLMPGTVVGANSSIGAGCTIKNYHEKDSLIKTNFDHAS